jgi:predicted DNA-binding protein
MSTTIELPDEIYARLEQQAKTYGLTIPQAIAQMVEETEKVRVAMAVERMRAKGILQSQIESSPSVPSILTPLQVQGQLLSEAIIEERC